MVFIENTLVVKLIFFGQLFFLIFEELTDMI